MSPPCTAGRPEAHCQQKPDFSQLRKLLPPRTALAATGPFRGGASARPAFPCLRVKQPEAPDADLGGPLGRSADDEDRLAGTAGPCAAFEGLPPFGQPERLADHRSQPSPAGPPPQPGQL